MAAKALSFDVGDYVVYPKHGVGRVIELQSTDIAGMQLELYVLRFEKEKMTLRVPTNKAESVGMRKLSSDKTMQEALATLKGKPKVKRTMWSRRAQEYEAKINSGDLVSIAEVTRDLFRADDQPEQSYSERQIFEAASSRLARELAAMEQVDEPTALEKILEILNKAAAIYNKDKVRGEVKRLIRDAWLAGIDERAVRRRAAFFICACFRAACIMMIIQLGRDAMREPIDPGAAARCSRACGMAPMRSDDDGGASGQRAAARLPGRRVRAGRAGRVARRRSSRSAARRRCAPRATPRRSSGSRSRSRTATLRIGTQEGQLVVRLAARPRRSPSTSPCRRSTGAAIAGSGDMRIDRVEGERFAAAIGGSGELEVGALRVGDAELLDRRLGRDHAPPARAETADVSIAGSGDVDARRLRGAARERRRSVGLRRRQRPGDARRAEVSIMGSGDVDDRRHAPAARQQDGLGRRQLRRQPR